MVVNEGASRAHASPDVDEEGARNEEFRVCTAAAASEGQRETKGRDSDDDDLLLLFSLRKCKTHVSIRNCKQTP